MERAPTILFAGGGTGGHLVPGIAVAEELLARSPSTRLLLAGSDRPVERQLLEETGIEHYALPSQRLTEARRDVLAFVRQNGRAYQMARQIIRDTGPRAVVGLGGFASVPVVTAAWRLGVPILLLEQNVIPGRATRWLTRLASTICVSFPETQSYLPRQCVKLETGNPVRASVRALYRLPRPAENATSPLLLVLGGSQGAVPLNEAMRALTQDRPGLFAGWRIVHQTGPCPIEPLRQLYANLGLEAVVEPFFRDVASWYRQATLAISRAGGTTMAELACAGCPCVVVPYPHAADDHQTANARHFADGGAAVLVMQRPFCEQTARVLGDAMERLLHHPQRLEDMRRYAAALARPDATRRVADVLMGWMEPSR